MLKKALKIVCVQKFAQTKQNISQKIQKIAASVILSLIFPSVSSIISLRCWSLFLHVMSADWSRQKQTQSLSPLAGGIGRSFPSETLQNIPGKSLSSVWIHLNDFLFPRIRFEASNYRFAAGFFNCCLLLCRQQSRTSRTWTWTRRSLRWRWVWQKKRQ